MNADRRDLASLLSRAECVLFDFDGPVCDLFGRHPADGVARKIHKLLQESGLLPEGLYGSSDPHAMLRESARGRSNTRIPEVLVQAERRVTEEELAAAGTAVPTPCADKLVAELVRLDKLIAVASNNSPDAVRLYLAKHGLETWFDGKIFGRVADPALMKPHPDSLLRALDALGVPSSLALLVGDSASDVTAAHSAGVAFLGYAPNAEKYEELLQAGVPVVTELSEVIGALGSET
ncbi:HAD hydrolase-like protein [Streptomyces sp. PA03-6a]|nr:HAD hydrolase-like protein [Streptomyces sp. PA03-6a]